MDMKPPPKIERRNSQAAGYSGGADRRGRPHTYRAATGASLSHDRLLQSLKSALGPIVGPALLDPEVTEVMVSNSDGQVWAKSIGTGWRALGFMAAEQALSVVNIAAHAAHRTVTEREPSFSAELPGSSFRFNGNIPPMSPLPGFAIRKKPSRVFTLADYVASGIMTPTHAEVMKTAIRDRLSIAIVGSTESGKTTLTNACLAEMAQYDQHVLTIEDTLELMNLAARRTEFRTVDASSAGPGRTMDDCLKEALRRSPDRIIVGEVRGREAWSMLKAWNTGHPGGVCTWHADSAEQALPRLEDMAREHPAAPADADLIRSRVAMAVNLVVFIAKVIIDTPAGPREVRRVTDVMRVNGYENGKYLTRHLDP